jgi:hypothetical protein
MPALGTWSSPTLSRPADRRLSGERVEGGHAGLLWFCCLEPDPMRLYAEVFDTRDADAAPGREAGPRDGDLLEMTPDEHSSLRSAGAAIWGSRRLARRTGDCGAIKSSSKQPQSVLQRQDRIGGVHQPRMTQRTLLRVVK